MRIDIKALKWWRRQTEWLLSQQEYWAQDPKVRDRLFKEVVIRAFSAGYKAGTMRSHYLQKKRRGNESKEIQNTL